VVKGFLVNFGSRDINGIAKATKCPDLHLVLSTDAMEGGSW